MNSEWEDCSHRIEALNILLHMAEELQENLTAAKKRIYAEEFDRATDMLDELLQLLAESLSCYPQDPPKHMNMNALDLKMMNFRLGELRLMVDEIKCVKQRLFEGGSQDKADVLNQVVSNIEDYLVKLKGLCFDVSLHVSSRIDTLSIYCTCAVYLTECNILQLMQPQNSIPDVIVWMTSGKKRVAVSRVPSHEIMYAGTGKARGKNCGKVQTITLTVSIAQVWCSGELRDEYSANNCKKKACKFVLVAIVQIVNYYYVNAWAVATLGVLSELRG